MFSRIAYFEAPGALVVGVLDLRRLEKVLAVRLQGDHLVDDVPVALGRGTRQFCRLREACEDVCQEVAVGGTELWKIARIFEDFNQ